MCSLVPLMRVPVGGESPQMSIHESIPRAQTVESKADSSSYPPAEVSPARDQHAAHGGRHRSHHARWFVSC